LTIHKKYATILFMSIEHQGPKFTLESSRAVIVLGHSERLEVGQLLAETLDSRRFFEELDLVTLNRSAAILGRHALKEHMKRSTVITHSSGVMRIPCALQIVAINPPEPVSFIELVKRVQIVAKDNIEAEPGAHARGLLDLFKAGIELARSPITSMVTPIRISRGYSTVKDLSGRGSDFRAGRAIVHSDSDNFGFARLADMYTASENGITAVKLLNHHHNELLFAPGRTIDALTPAIFPLTPWNPNLDS
jgi:hypothetical protein